LIAILVFNMTQRRTMNVGMRKRYASLWIAGLVAGLWGAAIMLKRFRAPDVLLLLAAAALVGVAVSQRRSIFVFRARCSTCGAPLALGRVLYHDDPRCPDCAAAEPTTKP
jgi:8-oxo-dGTP diphosphatase